MPRKAHFKGTVLYILLFPKDWEKEQVHKGISEHCSVFVLLCFFPNVKSCLVLKKLVGKVELWIYRKGHLRESHKNGPTFLPRAGSELCLLLSISTL